MKANIRQAEPKDAKHILALVTELARSAGQKSLLTAEYVRHYLKFPGNGILLAELDGQVVGMISYLVKPDLYHASETCLIEEMVVTEQARGRGIGSALLTELLRRMEANGCHEVSVSTELDNTRAIAFYKNHGITDEALFLEKHFNDG